MKKYRRKYPNGVLGSQFYSKEELSKFKICFGADSLIEYDKGDKTGKIYKVWELCDVK